MPLPEKGVQVYEKGGHRYAYKVTRCYRNAKGQPTCDRRSIGRVDDETGMLVPNLAYYEFYGSVAAPGAQAGAVPVAAPSVGTVFATRAALESCGALGAIEAALGNERAERALAVAACMLSAGETLDRFGPYCEHALVPPGFDERRAFELIVSITEGDWEAFFASWGQDEPDARSFQDEVVKAFFEIKSDRNTCDHDEIAGELFCAFVAFVVRMRINAALVGNMDIDAALRELVEVRCVRYADGRQLLIPLTEKQKMLIEALGRSEEDIRAFVECQGR